MSDETVAEGLSKDEFFNLVDKQYFSLPNITVYTLSLKEKTYINLSQILGDNFDTFVVSSSSVGQVTLFLCINCAFNADYLQKNMSPQTAFMVTHENTRICFSAEKDFVLEYTGGTTGQFYVNCLDICEGYCVQDIEHKSHRRNMTWRTDGNMKDTFSDDETDEDMVGNDLPAHGTARRELVHMKKTSTKKSANGVRPADIILAVLMGILAVIIMYTVVQQLLVEAEYRYHTDGKPN